MPPISLIQLWELHEWTTNNALIVNFCSSNPLLFLIAPHITRCARDLWLPQLASTSRSGCTQAISRAANLPQVAFFKALQGATPPSPAVKISHFAQVEARRKRVARGGSPNVARMPPHAAAAAGAKPKPARMTKVLARRLFVCSLDFHRRARVLFRWRTAPPPIRRTNISRRESCVPAGSMWQLRVMVIWKFFRYLLSLPKPVEIQSFPA